MIIDIESSDQLLDHLRATKRIGSQEKPRAVGRSPLEYLNESERARQARAALDLIEACPASLSKLVEIFVRGITS
jgi:hypothetical protein